MRRPQTAEELLDEAIAAPDIANAIKSAIPEKAQLYAAAYVLAFVSCIVLLFYAGWFRWVAGFLVAACLASSWSMRGALAELRRAYTTMGSGDAVLKNHRLLNGTAIALLGYALGAVWAGWPLPLLAVLIAAVINFAHYAGYRRYYRSGSQVTPSR
jgi:hypothetical protein